MKLSYKILSTRKCNHPSCQKFLKQNLIDRQADAEKCYKHYPNSKINRAAANKKPEVV